MKILVIGSGGRESAIVHAIKNSKTDTEIYCAPGNGGTSLNAENIMIKQDDIKGLVDFANDKKIDLTVVGPEIPLSLGIVDEFNKNSLKIFGPNKQASLLESSKRYAKDFLKKNHIKTADYRSFTDFSEAVSYVKESAYPLVIKASGLAAGKGVFISKEFEESKNILDLIFNKNIFGENGKTVIVEDYLDGFELSYMVITDGVSYKPLATSMDYKKILNGDKGENTGGMGAVSPNPFVSKSLENRINKTVIEPALEGLRREGTDYKGVLYAGIMVKGDDIYVLEFNVRFGDPETQAILIRLKSDIIDLFLSVINGNLKDYELEFDDNKSICLVLSSSGYPKDYKTGYAMSSDSPCDLNTDNNEDCYVFHAGTKKTGDKYYTSGGRVLNICVKGKTRNIVKKVYDTAKCIRFENKYYRTDIGETLFNVDNGKI